MKPHLSIYRMFTEKVADLGFVRDRTAWWKRPHGAIIQGIHLHKFSFTTSFLVHSAIHLTDFDLPNAPWLNGMISRDGWHESPHTKRRYSFDYTESAGSWQPCADELFAFTHDILIPWFEHWTDMGTLTMDTHSPLTKDQKAFLTRA